MPLTGFPDTPQIDLLCDGEFVRFAAVDGALPNCTTRGQVNCEFITSELEYIVDPADVVNGELITQGEWQAMTVPDGFSVICSVSDSALFYADAEIELLSSVASICEGQSADVTYSYCASTGIGGAALTAVEVTDDVCDAPVRGPDAPGDNDDLLEFGETWTFTCDTIIAAETTSTATMNGVTVEKALALDDSASATILEEKDRKDPEIIKCPPLLIYLAGAGGVIAAPDLTGLVGAIDNCTASDLLTIAQDPLPGASIPIGQTPVVFTVTDLAGNASQEASLIIVAGCEADFDGSDTIAPGDLAQLLATWGESSDPAACVDMPTLPCAVDLDDDGTVGAADLAELLATWGVCR